MITWFKAGGVQYYKHENAQPYMDAKLPRIKALLSFGTLRTGNNSENANTSLTLSTAAKQFMDIPPISGDVFNGSDLLFSGDISRIEWGDVLRVSLES